MSSSIDTGTGGDENRGANVIASYWAQAFVAIVVVALRLWARKMTKATGWDDWLMLITLCMYITLAGLITHSALMGGFRHLYYLSDSHKQMVLKWNYIYQSWAVLTTAPGKASVAVTIYRIMKPIRGWRYWTLILSITTLFCFSISNCILTYVQCNPPNALWNTSISDAKCLPPTVQTSYAITTSTVNVFVDIVLAVLPATIIWNLQMETKKKIGLAILLGLSLCAAVTGAIKTAYIANLGRRRDLTWKVYDLVLLAGAEIFVVIICGSIPPIKPLYVLYRDKIKATFRRRRSTYGDAAASTSQDELRTYDMKHLSDSSETGTLWSRESGVPYISV